MHSLQAKTVKERWSGCNELGEVQSRGVRLLQVSATLQRVRYGYGPVKPPGGDKRQAPRVCCCKDALSWKALEVTLTVKDRGSVQVVLVLMINRTPSGGLDCTQVLSTRSRVYSLTTPP